MRISGLPPKQRYEKGAYWRSSFHHSPFRLSLLAAGACLQSGEVLNSDVLQRGQNASVVQGTEFTAALKSLHDCVSQSIHAAQVSEPRSFIAEALQNGCPYFLHKASLERQLDWI